MRNYSRRGLLFNRLVAVFLTFLVAFSVSTSFLPPPPTKADSWSGWGAINTIYYNPSQEDPHNPFLYTAAQELKTYLQQMSGRSWTVVTNTPPAPPAVYLSVNATQLATHGDEAFRLVVNNNGVTITGKTAIACREGAYYLLDEKLGVRWFFKNAAWTVVPNSLANLVAMDEIHEPDFFWRMIACLNATLVNQSDLSDWYMHNRMLGAKWYPIYHTGDAIVSHEFGTLEQSEFNNHINAFLPLGPAWASHPANPSVLGPWQLNPNDPDVLQWSIDYVESFLDTQYPDVAFYPDILYYGSMAVSLRDGQGWEPPYDQATPGILNDTDNLTNDWFALVKNVADVIAAGHPGDYTGALNYADLSGIITEVLSPSVIVVVTAALSYGDHSNAERVIAAADSGATVGWYPYLNVWLWYHGQMVYPFMLDQARQIKWLHDNGVTYYNAEALDSWGDRGLTYYLVSKLLWDADADVDALTDDFFTKSFGAASDVMKQYYQTLLTPQRDIVMTQAYDLLSQAEGLVSGSELTRVRDLEYYTRFLWKYHHVGVSGLSNADLAGFYTFNCKVRDTGMLDYADLELELRSALSGRGYSTAQINALQNYVLPTAGETATWLAEGLAEFSDTGSQIINARFLTLEALGSSTPAVTELKGGSRVILVQSQGNENVRVNISTTTTTGLGMMWYNPEGIAIDWWMSNGVISPTFVNFTAEEAGTYILHVTTILPHESLSAFVDVPNHPAAILCARSSGNLWLEWDILNLINGRGTNAPEFTGANTQYFYVPSGTGNFTFGSTVILSALSGTLYSPSNVETAFNWSSTDYANNNSYVMITSPEAGLWKMVLNSTPQHNLFWLEGIPPLVWHDPEYLLVQAAGTAAPPVLNPIGNKVVRVGQLLQFAVSATDPNGDNLTYSASNLPPWASFTPATRIFSGTANQTGTYTNIHFEVSDGSLIDSENITITVIPNSPPVAVNDTYTTNEDTVLNRAAPGVLTNDTDPDGDNLTAVKVSDPAHGTLTLNSNGSFTYTPSANYNGTDSFTYRSNDGQANSNTATVIITITAVNDTPVALNDSYSAARDVALNVTAPGVLGNDTDIEGSTLTAIKVSNPLHGTVALNSNGSFTYTPSANYTGTDSFTYQANDGQANSNTATVTFTVTASNLPPVLADIGNKSVREGKSLGFTVSATDPNGDPLTYSASNLPAGASFNSGNHTFSWTPNSGQVAIYPNIQFSVSDNGSLTDSENITITVTANIPPVLAAIGNKSAHVSVPLQFTISATDSNGDTLTYSASNLPSWASFNLATQTFSGTANQTGTHTNVQFIVSDGSLTDSENITITVTTNQAPVLTNPGNKSVNEGAPLTFTLSATDSDNDTLTFSCPNLPSGANLNSTTGAFAWAPAYNQAGTYANVQFIASDSQLTDAENITITVNNVNRGPVLSAIGNKSVTEGQLLTFTVSATDPDSDSLTYSADNTPAGASFNGTTHEFTWRPASGQAGSYSNVRFAVTDGALTASENITITVGAILPSSPPPSGGGGGSSSGGGGGGGTTILLGSTTANGLMVEDVSAKDIYMKVELRIPKGTIVKNRVGQALTSIRITPKTENQAANSGSGIISQSYEIEPSGTTFDASATLIYRYSSSEIPADIPVSNLYIALWDPDTMTWIDLGGTVDVTARTVSVPIKHLSTYALMAHNRPADLKVTKFALTPEEIAPGETVKASIELNNQGDLIGNYEANLKLDNAAVSTRAVALNGGSSETIVFTLTSDTVGEHKASLGNLVLTFIVKKLLSPASFAVSELNINPIIADSGKNVEVSANVKNTGDLAGTHQTILSIDDVAVEIKEVALDSGGSMKVSFSFTADTAGQHKVSIGGLLAPFEVKSPPPLLPPPAATKVSKLELNSFGATPIYDKNTNTLAYVWIAYQMNQTWKTFPDARLMLTVFRDNQFLEQVPLLTLSELQADGQTGELSYVPPTGWETGEYAFRAELYDGDRLVQDTPLRKLTATPESTTAVVSWKTLGIIIGAALALGTLIVTLVLYYRRDMLRDYWR